MDNLVYISNGKAVTTSRLVANKFNKRHDVVIRRIKTLECSDDFTHHNFVVSEYVDASGKSNPEYIITKDGFTFLVMGFTGKKAAKFKEEYIGRFNQMEKQLTANVSQLDLMQMYLDGLKQQKQITDNHESRLMALENKPTSLDYYSIAAYGVLKKKPIPRYLASKLGRSATQLCKERDLLIGKIPDERYGYVGSYPKSVLEDVFADNL